MTGKEMWELFVKENGGTDAEYDCWAFGGAADQLAELVIRGIKTGTSSAYPLYELEGEALPRAGEYSVILDSNEEAVCVIKTTRVYVVPFREVNEEHACKEGEGDRSLPYWRKVHETFFTECMKEAGLQFDESMKVVCEEFVTVFSHGK